MSDTTWNEGLAASKVKAVEGKFESANRHVREGDLALLRAGRELRIVLRTYLKSNKEAFLAAATELFDRGSSMAYEYVQAADAEAIFAEAVKATGTDLKTVGVRTWAKLDRFTGTDDLKATGLEVIKTEAARAKAEGTKAFTNTGLADSIKAVKPGTGEATGTDDERKVGRIAGKYRDDYRTGFATFAARLQEKGARSAWLLATRQGATWGSASGALTPMALASLEGAWIAEEAAEASAVKKAQRAAAAHEKKVAEAKAAIEALRPTPAPKPQAEVKPETPKAPAPKRGASKKANPSVSALVKNAQGKAPVEPTGTEGKPEMADPPKRFSKRVS